uniref:Uncharacterized protein n=1 Tax=Tanacetum cinerariifolium TaxID=118510 RepID=A0A6L2KN02_TANCI|nr:hypothetical protein [Tanacetum cinerariifolium]
MGSGQEWSSEDKRDILILGIVASVKAWISLMMVEFSSCLLADSTINLDSDFSIVSLREVLVLLVFEDVPLCHFWEYSAISWMAILAPTTVLEGEWGYARSGIDHYVYFCDELAQIRRIFFARYDEMELTFLVMGCLASSLINIFSGIILAFLFLVNLLQVNLDDPNITIEEYIRLHEEKARRHGKVYNWETATYDSENDNDKVNMPLLPSLEPTVSYFDNLDFFKDFENEFPTIVYNDAQTSKSDLLAEPIFRTQHIDEFDLKEETSFSEYDEEEQNVLNFNDLFPFNVIYPNDSKSDKDYDDDKVDIEHSSRDMPVIPLSNVINADVPTSVFVTLDNGMTDISPEECSISTLSSSLSLYGVSKPHG